MGNIYRKNDLDNMVEEDEINPEDAAFMYGYDDF